MDATGEDIASSTSSAISSSSLTTVQSSTSSSTSKNHFRAIDGKLPPYPYATQTIWQDLSSLITPDTLSRVVETSKDSNGDYLTDGMMEVLTSTTSAKGKGRTTGDVNEEVSQRRQWGKARPEYEVHTSHQAAQASTNGDSAMEGSIGDVAKPGAASEISLAASQREKKLHFADYDLKRSWRTGATGEEITRDSRDKSWLLAHIVEHQLGGSKSVVCSRCNAYTDRRTPHRWHRASRRDAIGIHPIHAASELLRFGSLQEASILVQSKYVNTPPRIGQSARAVGQHSTTSIPEPPREGTHPAIWVPASRVLRGRPARCRFRRIPHCRNRHALAQSAPDLIAISCVFFGSSVLGCKRLPGEDQLSLDAALGASREEVRLGTTRFSGCS